MDKATLESVAVWAEERVKTGEEPPWTESSLTELAQLAKRLARGMSATITLQDSLQLEEHPETACPQGENILRLDSFQCHRGQTAKVQMPT